MSNKHTPGPWLCDGGVIYVDTRTQVCCGRGSVHGCCGEPDVEGDYFKVADCGEHDARLIAAAPDMYEALKWAATVIRPGSDLREAMDAALAKAEGRT